MRKEKNGEWNPGAGMPTRMASGDGGLGRKMPPVLSDSTHLGHACEEASGIARHGQHVGLNAVDAGRML